MTKRISVLLALLLLCTALLCGCSSSSAVAAKVGDKEITVATLENMYANNTSYASYYGYDLTTKEGAEGFRDLLLDSIIDSEVKYYEAVKAGVTLTDEEKAEAAAAAKRDYQDLYDQYLQYAQSNGAQDAAATANKYIADYLSSIGSSVKKLQDNYLESEMQQMIVNKHEEQLLTAYESEITEEKIREMYEKELADQETVFAATPSSYFTYETYSAYGYTCIPLTRPSGLFYVKHILVGDLATAELIKEKLAAGEDFEALLTEYNTDPGMDSNPEGYITGEGANFVEPFLNAALALENEGDVSNIVESDHGYHIIKRYGNIEAGPIAWDDIKDDYTVFAAEEAKSIYYADLAAEWAASDYVIRYPEAYANVGMSGVIETAAAAEESAAEEAIAE